MRTYQNPLVEEPATMVELATQLQLAANGEVPIRTPASAPITTQSEAAPTPATLEAIVAEDSTLKSGDQYVPIIINLPTPAGSSTTPTNPPMTPEEKRRYALIGATVFLLIIIAMVIFSVSKKAKPAQKSE